MRILFLLLFTMFCSLHDLRDSRIPNSAILCGLCCGLASVMFQESGLPERLPDRLLDRLLGFLIPYLLFFLPYLLGMIGGGDLKLLSVTGLFLGTRMELKLILYSLFLGAALSLVILIRRKNFFSRFLYLRNYIGSMVLSLHSDSATWHIVSGPGCEKSHAKSGKELHPPSYRGPGTSDGEFCFSVPIFLSLALLTAAGAA